MTKPHPRARLLRRSPLASATQLLLAGAAWPALAQQPAPAPASAVQLDAVVVTATRRDESVQEVPINITAVTREEIRSQNLKDLSDLVRTVPGLFLVDQGGRDANRLVVRGLNVSSISSSEGVGEAGGGVVAQYIGDIPLYLDLRLQDIDRVEALLGPQGTLYGAGTLGGAIRYIPARPEPGVTLFEVGGGINALSHSGDIGYEGRFVANLPLGERGAFRAAVAYYQDPGFIDYDYVVRQPGVSNPQPDFSDPAEVEANLRRVADANYTDVLSSKLAVRYEFTDAVAADLSWYHQNQDAGGRTINSLHAFGTGRYVSGMRFVEPNERQSDLLSLEINADLGFATLTSATGYSKATEDGQRDQTDLLLNFEYGYETFPSFAAYTHEEGESERLNQEIRLVSSGDGPWNWIVGAFYNRNDYWGTSKEFVPGLPEFWGVDRPDALEYFSISEGVFKETAFFGELGYDFTDRWRAAIGARRFEFDDSSNVGFDLPFLYTMLGVYGPDDISPSMTAVNVSLKDTIFKFNTSYRFSDDVLGYLTVSEGYRPGGSNAIAPCQDPLPPGQNVCALPNELLIKPDMTTNHEVGLKTAWLDGRLIVNGALYMIDWKDVQVSGATVNGSLPITVNGGKARSQGIELSTVALVTDALRLTASYSHTEAELTEDAPGLVSGQDAYDGDRLPGSPEQQANLALNYHRPLANGWAWALDYSVHVQSDVYTRAGLRNGGEVLPGYSTHNLAYTLSGDRWDVKLYAKNLFDKFAVTGVRNTRDSIREINGFALRSYYNSVLEPLRVGVDFNYRF